MSVIFRQPWAGGIISIDAVQHAQLYGAILPKRWCVAVQCECCDNRAVEFVAWLVPGLLYRSLSCRRERLYSMTDVQTGAGGAIEISHSESAGDGEQCSAITKS